ncbi:hypothetical protein [Lewinella cohaerens]|uniref:hypothetical protein n=1 Tax=Lewinella cohaerens TaxID=70995 RepID=UPI0003610177|nr:hypothetical protein [Lewinella cohaerens]
MPYFCKYLCLLIFLAVITIFLACDDDECPDETNWECPDYDECWNRRHPASAAFRMGNSLEFLEEEFRRPLPEEIPDDYFWEIMDTAFIGGVRFEALDTTADSYTWTVGNDTRTWEGRTFSLDFSCDQAANETIAITLTTERLKDSTCVDAGILTATSTREITFVKPGTNPIRGVYYGAFEEFPDDPMEIEIEFLCPPELCFCGGFDLFIKYPSEPGCIPETGSSGYYYRLGISLGMYFYYPDQGCYSFGREGFIRMGYEDVFMYTTKAQDSLYLSAGAWFAYPDSTTRTELHFQGSRVW